MADPEDKDIDLTSGTMEEAYEAIMIRLPKTVSPAQQLIDLELQLNRAFGIIINNIRTQHP